MNEKRKHSNRHGSGRTNTSSVAKIVYITGSNVSCFRESPKAVHALSPLPGRKHRASHTKAQFGDTQLSLGYPWSKRSSCFPASILAFDFYRDGIQRRHNTSAFVAFCRLALPASKKAKKCLYPDSNPNLLQQTGCFLAPSSFQ